jgi:pyrroline-5-carboxylate reductase
MTREQFLAALYTDEAFRARFTQSPREAAIAAGLPEADAEELARMDMEALALAARSFAKKRRGRGAVTSPRSR